MSKYDSLPDIDKDRDVFETNDTIGNYYNTVELSEDEPVEDLDISSINLSQSQKVFVENDETDMFSIDDIALIKNNNRMLTAGYFLKNKVEKSKETKKMKLRRIIAELDILKNENNHENDTNNQTKIDEVVNIANSLFKKFNKPLTESKPEKDEKLLIEENSFVNSKYDIDHVLEIEQRLSKIERVLGVEKLSFENTGIINYEISQSFIFLKTLVAGNGLDEINEKADKLTTKLQELNTQSSHSSTNTNTTTIDPSTIMKINNLYNMAKKIEPIIDIMPQVVSRLSELSKMHIKLNDQITNKEKNNLSVFTLSRNIEKFEENLNTISKNLAENKEMENRNLEIVEKKIMGLTEKLENLQNKKG